LTKPDAKHILIAPLDWGSGHTTRCIPIIRHIQRLGHIPVVAGNDAQRSFIEENFRDINFIHLEGYNVTYSKWNKYAQMGLLSQVPRLYKAINREHTWLLKQVNELHIDGIISDNRYGLYHKHVPSVILTHQLQLQTGMGSYIDSIARKVHYKHLNHFRETWVTDLQGSPNLSGRLAHVERLPQHTKYIGLLSQFEEENTSTNTDSSLLILLSGPEPQRSALSGILWQQLQQYKGSVVFVEGSSTAAAPAFIPDHITYHKWLTKEALVTVIKNAAMVICRSGYSTIMDLAALQKKAILIPTPGQTEQEYLGKYLQEQDIYYSIPQKKFALFRALDESANFSYHQPNLKKAYSQYKDVVSDWIQKL